MERGSAIGVPSRLLSVERLWNFPAPVVNKDARIKAVARPIRTTTGGKPPRAKKAADGAAVARARRNWIVLAGLVAFLAMTGAILKTLAPAPLAPDLSGSLYAVGPEQSIGRIFDTPVAVKPGRWHSIYVHHSLTQTGNAATLAQDGGGIADHFLIGNGDPIADGAVETESRWSRQIEAGSVPGVEISSDCISICMIGNFNRVRPSPTQQARLLELVSTLQQQLGIDSNHVVLGIAGAEGSVAGIGKRFPGIAFRGQLAQ